VQELHALGIKHALNSTSENFFDELQKLLVDLKPTVLYEYLGGELPGKIFEKMLSGSEMIVIGNLSHTPLVINSGDMIFTQKVIKGFLMSTWINSISKEEKHKWQ